MTSPAQRLSVMTGAVLFALFAVIDITSPWLFPAPADAPPIADTLALVLGVIALLAIGVWFATKARWAMWVSVVIRVIGAFFSVMAFTDPTVSTGYVVENIAYLVLTVVAIVLVVPALRSSVREGGGAAVGV